MRQPAKNAAKKRPVPTKRSPVIKNAKAPAAPHSGAEDDVKITALELPAGKLSPEMAAYFKKCDEKLGFVPNVLKAFAFDDAKLQAFVDYRQELVQNAENLSKLEIEMIATVVSSQNRCFYCITAHGNAVRQLGGPVLGEMMVMNYRAARLDKRQRAMLDFAVKLTTQPWEVEEGGPRAAAPRRLHRPRHLGHRLGRRLLQHDQPDRLRDRHAAQQRLSRAGAITIKTGGHHETSLCARCRRRVGIRHASLRSVTAGRHGRDDGAVGARH